MPSSASVSDLPGSSHLWSKVFVPGTRKESLGPAFAGKHFVVARPLISREFIRYFNTIAVRVAEVNANREPMVGHVINRHLQLFEPLV